MNEQRLSLIALTFVVLAATATERAVAVTPPMVPGCDYTDSLLYDGFGWNEEFNQSCEPVINRQLGAAVNLTAVHWDGNSDIANRTIQCDLFYFDESQQIYIAEDRYRNFSHTSYQLKHLPIPPIEPFVGWKSTSATAEGLNISFVSQQWSVDNGVYSGGGILDYPYLELITTDDGVKAVRRWVNNFIPVERFGRDGRVSPERPGYYECRDIAGSDFSPTGVTGKPTAKPATLSGLEFSVSSNPSPDEASDIFNLATGQPVDLQKVFWNYNSDIAGKQGVCYSHDFANGEYARSSYGRVLDHPYHFTSSAARVPYRVSWPVEELGPEVGHYSIVDNILGYTLEKSDPQFNGNPLFSSEYVEVIDGGVRLWQNSRYFEECLGYTPTGKQPSTESQISEETLEHSEQTGTDSNEQMDDTSMDDQSETEQTGTEPGHDIDGDMDGGDNDVAENESDVPPNNDEIVGATGGGGAAGLLDLLSALFLLAISLLIRPMTIEEK